jgi:hypothetical protein
MTNIATILGAFSGQIFARTEGGTLVRTILWDVPKDVGEWRRLLSSALLRPESFTWEPAEESDGGTPEKFDAELRAVSLKAYGW